ncbi:hypothetical protein PILCRDRAFT_818822 [Piloderma croceum F 1598]|uniref:Uncharacterized protein n=1 Tax=Piloderma croceum (strain F 1598) TaxID=765440 RepID=A0A0C3BBX5_PILCF|nr:hypothetical protein PILCRDRAFT_818822 [Piloderma croceum F 1598]
MVSALCTDSLLNPEQLQKFRFAGHDRKFYLVGMQISTKEPSRTMPAPSTLKAIRHDNLKTVQVQVL